MTDRLITVPTKEDMPIDLPWDLWRDLAVKAYIEQRDLGEIVAEILEAYAGGVSSDG